jgi:hypothetical protein
LPLWLPYLRRDPTDIKLLNDLDRLENWLKRLSSIPGFDRLAPGIKSRDNRNWSHTYLELDVLQQWESVSLLKEIQPKVLMKQTSADFLLCVDGKEVWGEITQFEALKKARLSRGVTQLLSPEEELRRMPQLVRKLNRQLPAGSPALAVVNARRTIQRSETWEAALPLIFDRLPNMVGIIIRGRSRTRFYKNLVYDHLGELLMRMWNNYQLI